MVVVVVMVGGCSAVSLTTAYEGKANVWRNRARVALSTYSQTDNGEDPLVSFGEPLEQVITTWTNLGKQN